MRDKNRLTTSMFQQQITESQRKRKIKPMDTLHKNRLVGARSVMHTAFVV